MSEVFDIIITMIIVGVVAFGLMRHQMSKTKRVILDDNRRIIDEKEKSFHRQFSDYKAEEYARIEKARRVSNDLQRATIKGLISQQIASLFPEFYSRYRASEARFLGTPIDFVIFRGMSAFNPGARFKEEIDIVLLEVKTGDDPRLSPLEEAIKNAVDNHRVRFDILRLDLDNIPERLTDKDEGYNSDKEINGYKIGYGLEKICRPETPNLIYRDNKEETL